jgi:hypothetical protein
LTAKPEEAPSLAAGSSGSVILVHEWHDVGGFWAEIAIVITQMLPDQDPPVWPHRVRPDLGAKIADMIRQDTWT